MATTREILGQHDKFLDSLIDGFEDKLDPLISDAQKRTLKALEKQLTFDTKGKIDFTPANQRVLRSISRIFKREMNRSTKEFPHGYKGVADDFTGQFADHLPKFQSVLNDITESLKGPKLPPVKFNSADIDLFASQAVGASDMLLGVLDQTANAAKRQALFSVGGLKFSDLASTLADQFGKTKAQAVTIANTSVTSFYRTIANQSYKKVEQGLKPGAVVYQYVGPDDSLTRPFCDAMIGRDPMTRAEIDELDNGQGLPVWSGGGGWNCRHSLILAERPDEDR
jgi:hypothetical protein